MSGSLVELAQGKHAGLLFILADPYPRLTRTIVLKKTAPLIGQSLLSGAWPPNDRWCLVQAGRHGDGPTIAAKMVMERVGGDGEGMVMD
jgi:hypothetical protein